MDTKDPSVSTQPTSVPNPPASTPLPNNPLPGESTVQSAPSPLPKKSHKVLFIVVGLIVTFVVLLGGAGATLAAVAYDKLSFNNPELEDSIEQWVVGMPFMPKTKAYILNASSIAHTKHTKNAFNLSLSAEGNGAGSGSALNLDRIDIEAKGDIDYTNQEKPDFSMNASITKDFNMDVRMKDPIIYFKVNKVPPMIYSALQLDQSQVEPIFTQWIQYDTSTLDTEASVMLENDKIDAGNQADDYLERLWGEKVMDRMNMSEESSDGVMTYKFDLEADDAMVDAIMYQAQNEAEGKSPSTLRTDPVKPSDYIKDYKMKIWIEKSSYLVQKVTLSFTYDQAALEQGNVEVTPSRVLGVSDVLGIEDLMLGQAAPRYKVAMVIGLSDYGKDFKVEIPEKSLKPEEVVEQLMTAVQVGRQAPSSTIPSQTNSFNSVR